MKKIVITKGWIEKWESDSTFTIGFNTEDEEDRRALLEVLEGRIPLKITIEEIEPSQTE